MVMLASLTSIPTSSLGLGHDSCQADRTGIKQQVRYSPSPSTGRRQALVVGTATLSFGSAAVVAVVAVARAMAIRGEEREKAVLATRRRMQLFTQGDVKGSVVEFDKALELDPRQRPYLWQRGLSLYYLNRFEEGATQFRDDVAVNPDDTEEASQSGAFSVKLSCTGQKKPENGFWRWDKTAALQCGLQSSYSEMEVILESF